MSGLSRTAQGREAPQARPGAPSPHPTPQAVAFHLLGGNSKACLSPSLPWRIKSSDAYGRVPEGAEPAADGQCPLPMIRQG